MRDPTSEKFARWTELAASGEMVGPNRPIGRVTVGRNAIIGHGSYTRPGLWRNILFEQARQVELLNVVSISISRSLDSDAATCTIVAVNDDMQPYDYRPQGMDTGIGRPGYRTFNRGIQSPIPTVSVYDDVDPTPGKFPTDWRYPLVEDELGHEWLANVVYEGGSGALGGADARYNRGLLIPNRLLRTYQGYGSDNLDVGGHLIGRGEDGYVHPAFDTQLVQTGVWLVDSVTYTSDGMLTLSCRDLGKLLLVQQVYPPMVPQERFPLQYGPPGTNATDGTTNVGEITDWSHAIKELCGWAGFTWWCRPSYYPGREADPLLGVDPNGDTPLRVWGSFEPLGAGPKVATRWDELYQKSFAEAINYLKDPIGLIFFIADSGAAVCRLPNLMTPGNYIVDPDSAEVHVDGHPIELHEGANLLSYTVTLDDSQLRSSVIVTGSAPGDPVGAGPVAGGVDLGGGDFSSLLDYRNFLAGQTRAMMIPGENTKGFTTVEECQRYAEMVALKILFTLRKGQARILGHPGLHLDDQVRIFERVTHEYNIHYVSGINSEMNLQSGEWTMDVTTHWLGSDPSAQWFLDYVKLTDDVLALPALQERLGSVSPGTGIQEPEQWTPEPEIVT